MNNNNQEIKATLSLATQALSTLGNVNPAFVGISLITGIINELIGCYESTQLEKRLNMLEKEIEQRNVDIYTLQKRVNGLEEHEYYVMRNNIKVYCTSSLPEVGEIYCKCIVDCLMNQNHEMEEELCEILQQCNANDIDLMVLVKKFIQSGRHDAAEQAKKAYLKDIEDYKHGVKKYRDRSYIYGDYTIFWEDFMKEYHVDNVNDMTQMLNRQLYADDRGLVNDWAYLSRAIIKLSNLGVLQLEYTNKIGTNSPYDIDRFHVTLFGQKMLDYL